MVLDDASIVLLSELVAEALPLYERADGSYARWVSRTLLLLEDDLSWYHRQQAAWLKRVAEEGL